MHNFNLHLPTKVVFGNDALSALPVLLRDCGCSRVLLHYGGRSALASGLIDKVRTLLNESQTFFVELGGVLPNPRISKVYEGIALGRGHCVDFILAVGGGSVIDSAKAIGYGLTHDFDVWELFDHKRKATACLPIGTIPTIAAAGSEMSNSCVISNDATSLKRSYNDEVARPRFAIMDPALTLTLPAYQTACGVVDILMHTQERYFVQPPTSELTDSMAEALMRTVIDTGLRLMERPDDLAARAEIQWASNLSHNGLTGCGAVGSGFPCHKLEHELSAKYDVAHGAGLAAIWASWARHVLDSNVARFERFALNVMRVPAEKDGKGTALAGIAAMERLYRQLGMPTTLAELGVAPDDAAISELAQNCLLSAGGPFGTLKRLDVQDIVAIYTEARG